MMAASPRLSVTVLVATYNRAAMLDDCLLWLRTQPWQPGDAVIIADNGSTDRTAEVVARHHDAAPIVRYVLETTPGKSAALQTALTHADGDIVAFTDDDVRVGAAWLDTIRQAMQQEPAVLVGGPVRPRWERAAPAWLAIGDGPYTRLAAPIALLDYGPDRQPLGPRTLLGANMAIRRDALEELGGFATHLGKLRDTLLSGEDADLCERVRQRGWPALYLPDAGVQHWVPASRMRLGYFLNWFYWSGITHAALDEAGAAGPVRHGTVLPAWLTRRAAAASGRSLLALARLRPDLLVDNLDELAFVCGYAVRHRRLVAAATPVKPSARRQPA